MRTPLRTRVGVQTGAYFARRTINSGGIRLLS
jgi:hypothetical protein